MYETPIKNTILSMDFHYGDDDSDESYYPSDVDDSECPKCKKKLTFESDRETDDSDFFEIDEDEGEDIEEDEGEDEGEDIEEDEGEDEDEDIEEDEVKNILDIILKRKENKKENVSDEEIVDNLLFSMDDYVTVTTIKDIIKKKNPKSHDELVKIMSYLNDNSPTILEILDLPIDVESKTELVEKCEMLLSIEPNTPEFFAVKKMLIKSYNEYKMEIEDKNKYTEEQMKKMCEDEMKINQSCKNLSIKYKILSMNTSFHNKETMYKAYKKLIEMNRDDEERTKLNNWMKTVLSYPWGVKRNWYKETENIGEFLLHARNKLDERLFGMTKVKEQILIYLMNKILYPEKYRYNIGLLGEPGTGKTTIAKVVSELLDIGFQQISLGGMTRTDYIKGHDYTYIGSQPGMLVKSIIRMQHTNGVILLDEYDKIEPSSNLSNTMLHITDPTQNDNFHDNYFGDLTVDLSKIWFIYSMNELPLDRALRDRIFVVKVPSYSIEDKKNIVSKYVLPKILKKLNMNTGDIVLSDECINLVVGNAGIRSIEKMMMDIIDKLNFLSKTRETGMDISFKISKKIEWPFVLTLDIFKQLNKGYDDQSGFNRNDAMLSMYT